MGVGLGVVALHGLITAARRLQGGWRWGWEWGKQPGTREDTSEEVGEGIRERGREALGGAIR